MHKRPYTQQELDFLRELYPRLTRRELHEAFNLWFPIKRTLRSIVAALKNHRIRSGRDGRFTRGDISWNAGKRFFPGGRSVETRFKPGHRPRNWVPIGTEVTDTDGFRKLKIRDDAPVGKSRLNWVFLHIHLWEQANGPVPDGYIVAFRDADRQNCELDNLVLLTRAENLWLNRHRYAKVSEELRQPMRALARLQAKQFHLEKKE